MLFKKRLGNSFDACVDSSECNYAIFVESMPMRLPTFAEKAKKFLMYTRFTLESG